MTYPALNFSTYTSEIFLTTQRNNDKKFRWHTQKYQNCMLEHAPFIERPQSQHYKLRHAPSSTSYWDKTPSSNCIIWTSIHQRQATFSICKHTRNILQIQRKLVQLFTRLINYIKPPNNDLIAKWSKGGTSNGTSNFFASRPQKSWGKKTD